MMLSAVFVVKGTDISIHGTLTLCINDNVVGSAQIKTRLTV